MVSKSKKFIILFAILFAIGGLLVLVDQTRLNMIEQSSQSAQFTQIEIQEAFGDNSEINIQEEQSSANTSGQDASYKSNFFCEFSSVFRQTSLCSALEGQIDFIDKVNNHESSVSAPADQSSCPECAAAAVQIVANNDQTQNENEDLPKPSESAGSADSAESEEAAKIETPPVTKPQSRARLGRGNTTIQNAPSAPVAPPSPSNSREAIGGRGSQPQAVAVEPRAPVVTKPQSVAIAPPPPPPTTVPDTLGSGGDSAPLSFETCDDQNNYFEKQFDRHATDRTFLKILNQTKPGFNEHIQTSCFLSNMNSTFGRNSGIYGRCEVGQNSVTSKSRCSTRLVRVRGKKVRQKFCSSSMASAARPCLSERYVNTVKNSFDLVTDCLKDYLTSANKFAQVSTTELHRIQERNSLSVFSLLTIESGLNINAMSPSGAGGLGQLTGDGLEVVAKAQIPKIREFLTRPESPIVCKNLSRVYLQQNLLPRIDYDYNCDRISLTRGQPLVGLVYSYGHIKQAEEDIYRFLKSSDNKYFNRFNLDESEMDRVVTALALWSHNTGSLGLIHPMTYLLKNKYSKKKVTNVDQFISELKLAMRTHSLSRSRSRINETSNYYSKIANAQENAGQKCLAQ